MTWCFFHHHWSQWSAPKDEQSVITYNPRSSGSRTFTRTSRVQGRFCFSCGRIQERVIRILGERPGVTTHQ